ncbi:MAG: energy-coupling factor transporter ATPase [Clostridia bacterium]|nr:energy-coupling factor transporter ATPase [Clostridia bacterium]
MNTIIKVEDLKFSYPVDENTYREVLHGLSFEIEKGTFTAIIGHNGSGKSTLAKLLCGMLTPTGGKVYCSCDGKMLSMDDQENFFEIRKNFGMVFQHPDNQLVATVVEEDVAFAPENMGIEPSEIRKRVDDALAVVGLSEYALHDTHKLSGGQKQRVAIAGILAMLPECIIFDESTAMLDPGGREEIIATIKKLQKEKNITVILITHYMNEAAQADRIIVVDGGKIIADGSPVEVFDKDDLLYSAGLEAPQSSNLVKRLKNAGADISGTALNSDEAAIAIGKALKK